MDILEVGHGTFNIHFGFQISILGCIEFWFEFAESEIFEMLMLENV